MRTRFKPVALATAIGFVLSGLGTAAEIPRKKPLGAYADLWDRSVFTVPPVALQPEPPEAQIAKLQERVRELQAEVARLKAAAEAGDPRPAIKAPKKDQTGLKKWIAEFTPKPITRQFAESSLEEFGNREAVNRKLDVKRRKVLPPVEGAGTHRARIEIELQGPERILYQWLDRVHSPADFRGITALTIGPARNDDTQVECRVTLEQWFLPENHPRAKVRAADLLPLTESAYYPIEILLAITQASPREGFRLDRAEMFNALDAEGILVRNIRVLGRADELVDVATFNLNILKSETLRNYQWETQLPTEEPRSGKWQFLYDGQFARP
jgi:hypothetical protein